MLAEAPFYGALSANRPWLLDGYLETVYDIIDTASDLAKRQFPHCEPGAREPTSQSSLALQSRCCANAKA